MILNTKQLGEMKNNWFCFIKKIRELSTKQKIIVGVETLIMILLVCIASFKTSTGVTDISGVADSTVVLDANHPYLTQSYQIPNRNITGINLKVDPSLSTNADGTLNAILSTDKDAQNILASSTLSLNPDSTEYNFIFDKIKINQGSRYYIHFVFTPNTPDAALAVCVNSDYAGLSLAGESIPGCIQATVLYSYAGNLAGMLKIIIIFTCLTFMFMLAFDKDFGACVAMAFASVVIYILFFGMLGILNAGISSLYFICMVIAVVTPLLMAIKGKTVIDMISPGMIAFWALFIIYLYFDRNVITGKIDDLNHWALTVRDMWYSDSFAYHVGNAMRAPRYTPGFAVIEYFFLRLYGSYREGIMLLAAHTTGFAFMSIMLSNIKWKKCIRVIPIGIIMATLPILYFRQYYGELYVDGYLGILGAFLFICYFTEEHSTFKTLRIALCSILLIMTKEMGIVIAFGFYLAVLIDIVVREGGFKGLLKKIETKAYFKAGLSGVIMFIFWEIYVAIGSARVSKLEAVGQDSWTITETLKKGFEALLGARGNITEIRTLGAVATNGIAIGDNTVIATAEKFSAIDIVKSLIEWMYDYKGFWSRSFIAVMAIQLFVVIFIAFSGLYKKLGIRIKTYTITVIIGLIIYQIALLGTYIFVFYEGDPIAAQERYIASYMLLITIAIVGTIIVSLNQRSEASDLKPTIAMLMLSAIFVWFVPLGSYYYTTEENFGMYYTDWSYYQTIVDPVRTFADRGERILYIGYEDSITNPYENYAAFHAAIVPVMDQKENRWRLIVDDGQSGYNEFIRIAYKTSFKRILADYDYVYIRDLNDYFVKNYVELFVDPSEIMGGAFYSVNHDVAEDDLAVLSKIAYKNLQ